MKNIYQDSTAVPEQRSSGLQENCLHNVVCTPLLFLPTSVAHGAATQQELQVKHINKYWIILCSLAKWGLQILGKGTDIVEVPAAMFHADQDFQKERGLIDIVSERKLGSNITSDNIPWFQNQIGVVLLMQKSGS